jgi:hypothetical protein
VLNLRGSLREPRDWRTMCIPDSRSRSRGRCWRPVVLCPACRILPLLSCMMWSICVSFIDTHPPALSHLGSTPWCDDCSRLRLLWTSNMELSRCQPLCSCTVKNFLLHLSSPRLFPNTRGFRHDTRHALFCSRSASRSRQSATAESRGPA